VKGLHILNEEEEERKRNKRKRKKRKRRITGWMADTSYLPIN
jgi:hypothetical protein